MPTRRGKKWVSRPTIDGKTVWGTTFATKREALDDEARIRNRPKPGVRETADSFALRWVDDFRPHIEPTTERAYRRVGKAFAAEFSGVPLGDLERGLVRDWAAEQSRETVALTRSMLNDAMSRDRLRDNPLAGFKLPERKAKKVRVPSHDELKAILTACEVHKAYAPTFRAMVTFAAYQAMRPGEVACLQRADVDRKAGVVFVTKNLDRHNGVKPYTKNHDTREILLMPEAAEALDSYPAPFSGLVFATPNGRMFSAQNIKHYWHPVREKAGLEDLQFRSLRHFGATHLLELGNTPSDVAYFLGHKDGGRLVMERYGHPQRSAMERLRASVLLESQEATG